MGITGILTNLFDKLTFLHVEVKVQLNGELIVLNK